MIHRKKAVLICQIGEKLFFNLGNFINYLSATKYEKMNLNKTLKKNK